MMPYVLSVFIVLYGLAGLLFAAFAFPVMQARNRLRKEQYDAHLDAMVYDLTAKLSDLRRSERPMMLIEEQKHSAKP